MASTDYRSAVRAGTLAAARLHEQLGIQQQVEAAGGNVDVFGVIDTLDLPLLLRPLQGLLGAYLSQPDHGVIVTTRRPMNIQRFTAAHELGHFILKHQPSLDDESILRRMPLNASDATDLQEIEADAFAVEFMMPRWLFGMHSARQSWTVSDFTNPRTVYQLSLRLGASYEATCWTLVRHNLIASGLANRLVSTPPRELKVDLLGDHRPSDYRGDVWLLTERDDGARVDGSRNDLFVLRFEEHSGGGYLWDVDDLRNTGFSVLSDRLEAATTEGVGDPVYRTVTTEPPETYRGPLVVNERRPWEPNAPLTEFQIAMDLSGPEEEGLSRAERRKRLEDA